MSFRRQVYRYRRSARCWRPLSNAPGKLQPSPHTPSRSAAKGTAIRVQHKVRMRGVTLNFFQMGWIGQWVIPRHSCILEDRSLRRSTGKRGRSGCVPLNIRVSTNLRASIIFSNCPHYHSIRYGNVQEAIGMRIPFYFYNTEAATAVWR